MVLWVSAALAAVAFSLSNTVLGETERASTGIDGLRSEYLAAGGIWRATDELLWSFAGSSLPGVSRPNARIDYTFPSGTVRVDIIPETAKLDVNSARPEDLYRLLTSIGVDATRAREIALAIAAGRAPGPPGGPDLSVAPSFRGPRASFEEIEELLQVKDVTPDLLYGTYVPDGAGLTRRPGLADLLSVYGSRDRIDANTAAPGVLAAIGMSPDAINALLVRRQAAPLTEQQLVQMAPSLGPAAGRLRVGGNSIFTMRATARLRLENGQYSDLRRTVAAQVKYMPPGYDAPIHVLRWYEAAWSN
jgi:general secretion pathway protein K